MKTHYFQNCLGVFQGGGCKASAYVGAFREAVNRGVSFSELVGTSAGSIVAVLIAAGATPDQLEQYIRELDFKKFQEGPRKLVEYKPPMCADQYKRIPIDFVKKISPIFSHLGMHQSVYLRQWMNEKLASLLPKVTGTIKFSDLLIPATVVVTDLKTKKVKLFDDHSEEDVSYAVQCSCNIPFYFQPVDMRYVDGGILSNLPAFVFAKNKDKLYNRVLAFTLYSSEDNESIDNILAYFKALIFSTIDGNTELQSRLHDNMHAISINTGDISSIDFDKITDEVKTDLINKGKTAAFDFFENEGANVTSIVQKSDLVQNSFNAANFLNETLKFDNEEILISCKDTEWLYDFFPLVIRWKNQGAHICCLLQSGTDKPVHTDYRQRFLKFSGIQIKVIDEIPFLGYVINAQNVEKCRTVIFNKSFREGDNYFAKLYSGEEDFEAIQLFREKFIAHLSDKLAPDIFAITLSKAEPMDLISKIKQVKQYNNNSVSVTIHELNVTAVTFITRYVRGYKYRQIAILFELFRDHGLKLFEPAKINLKDGKSTLVAPPVVEKIGNKYYVIEGNTRFTYAYRNDITKLTCIVVENVSEPLPSKSLKSRYEPKQILLTDKDLKGSDRYDEFVYALFRKIEKAIRNPSTCLM